VAGTNKITIATTGTGTLASENDALGAILSEVKNCNTSSVGSNGTLNTAATGSALTLTLGGAPTSGDMVWAAFIDSTMAATAPPIGVIATMTPGSGFTALSNSKTFGKLAEYNTSTSSTSVQVTYSGTDTIAGVALVIKQGPIGTSAPATKYIDHYQAEEMPASTSQALNFPCSGNLIVGLFSDGNSAFISSITGSTGTWNVGPKDTTVGASQIPYATTPTCASTTTVTPTFNTAPNAPGSSFELVSISNATSTFDTSSHTTGTQSTAANLSSVTITPGALNEITFGIVTITWHTETGTVADGNSHTPTLLSATDSAGDDASPSCSTATPNSTLDFEDNGVSFFQNTSDTSLITFIFSGTQTTGSCTTNPTGVTGWGSAAAAFN
jgi:hypothetical protein